MLIAQAAEVIAAKRVARFVYDRGHLFADGSAKWKVFEPSNRDNTTSVFVVDGLTEEDIWTLDLREKTAMAHADVSPMDVREVGLDLYFDDEPPRHAAIRSWPPDKALLKMLAQLLAAKAVVQRR